MILVSHFLIDSGLKKTYLSHVLLSLGMLMEHVVAGGAEYLTCALGTGHPRILGATQSALQFVI